MLSWNMARNNTMQLTEKIFNTAPLESKSNLQTGTGCLGCFVISDMLKKSLDFPLKFQHWRAELKIPTSMHFTKKLFITKMVKE